MTIRTRQRIFIAMFIAPALSVFCLLVAWPGAQALLYSLQQWDGLGEAKWVGLSNFQELFKDDLFLSALRNNLILFIGGGVITLGLSLFFASLLHRGIRGASLFRVAFFFPNILASVAVALVWLLLYSTTDFGVFNALLGQLHELLSSIGFDGLKDSLPFAFTDSRNLIPALIPMMVWTAVGFYMVLFLAAMQNIPESYYEAAKLDGASGFAQFRYITLPLIREVFTVGIVFFIISSAKFFDSVWVIENQYPTKESHVMATVLYQKIFTEYNIGYGAAVAVLLFVLVLCATLITLRFASKEAIEY